jgi:plasminogen activator
MGMGVRQMKRIHIGLLTTSLAVLGTSAIAQDWAEADSFFGGGGYVYSSPDDTVQLRGSIGVLALEAREHVFAGSGATENLSLLIWQGVAPMATGEVLVRLPSDWTLSGKLRAAISGDSYMVDYDWFGPDFVSYDFDDWTHRSQHPNTSLDWYFDGSLALGRDVVVEENVRVNLNGGFKYTDVQWAAVGGSAVYSGFDGDPPGGFRDTIGTFPDVPGITYRQQLPTLFAGLDVEAEENGWTYNASARAGMTLFGLATDDHWMRSPPRRFIDHLGPTPMASLSFSAGYDVSDNLGVFFEGAVEKVFLGRGDLDVSDAGTHVGTFVDTIGAELGTLSVSTGLKGSF